MFFAATYFDGRTSLAHEVMVQTDAFGRLSFQGPDTEARSFPLAACRFSPALGHDRRVILLPDQGRLETADREAVAWLERDSGLNRGLRLVNGVESNWRLVLASLLGLVAALIVAFRVGLPWLAAGAARLVPIQVTQRLDASTLEVLDLRFCQPSELGAVREEGVRAEVARLAVESGLALRVEFRKSELLKANALALPGGTLVVTDALVDALADKDALTGLLVHEMTHVRARHGLRMVLQQTGVWLLVSLVAGDVASLSSAAVALPVLLLDAGYSREFERQADEAAGRYLLIAGRSTGPFRELLLRIAGHDDSIPAAQFLSSHPDTASRVKALLAMEERAGEGVRP